MIRLTIGQVLVAERHAFEHMGIGKVDCCNIRMTYRSTTVVGKLADGTVFFGGYLAPLLRFAPKP